MKQLPNDFKQLTVSALGEEEYNRLAEAIDQPTPTSIRLNSQKISTEELSHLLQGAEPVSWCPNAYYLADRPQFTFDPLLHSGCYYVQEASSMFLAKLLLQHFDSQPIVALDACAAPGGKSTLALSALPEGSLLVANEYVRQRSQVLAENLIKWGNPNIIVTNSDTSAFTHLPNLFDLIICDAPCSGEGMFRKDQKAIDDWSMDNVRLCQSRQREIVANLWQALRPGGLFIYSTCTFNRYEDEDNVEWIKTELNAKQLTLPNLSDSDDTPHSLPNGHFYPHLVKGEGFFLALFTKDDEDSESEPPRKKKKKDTKGKAKPSKLPKELASWLTSTEQFIISEPTQGTFNAFPSLHADILSLLSDYAHIVHFGIQLATLKGKNLQPCHSLAMSTHINRSAFRTAEVDYDQAIAYLRTESITLPPQTPTGYVLLTYRSHPLGFVKNIGNRANNLYPAEWKIKTTHIPKPTNNNPI